MTKRNLFTLDQVDLSASKSCNLTVVHRDWDRPFRGIPFNNKAQGNKIL